MGLLEFFNNGNNSNNGNIANNVSRSESSGNPEVEDFCKKFFANAGDNYKNTPIDFLKLCFKNREMITGLLNSPLLKKVENIANNAINKGIVSKDTVKSFEEAAKLLK